MQRTTRLGIEVGDAALYPHQLRASLEALSDLVQVRTETTVIEHDDILALPTTGVLLLAAPEAGYVRLPLAVAVQGQFDGGTYTNEAVAGATLQLSVATIAASATLDWGALLATGQDIVTGLGIGLTGPTTDVEATGLELKADNGADGDFTGGHIGNQLIVTVWYLELPVAGARAHADIGSGTDGTVQIAVAATGTAGNAYTVEVALGDGTDLPLTVGLSDGAILVTLGTDEAGDPDATKNTAELVAGALAELTGFLAAYTGTGATALTLAEGPTAFTGGL